MGCKIKKKIGKKRKMIRRPLPKIWLSYGCQNNILDFLSKLEVLQLQVLGRDTYNRTIARCQYTYPISKMFAFTWRFGTHHNDCIMLWKTLLNGLTGEHQFFEDDRLDLKNAVTLVVYKELYAFK